MVDNEPMKASCREWLGLAVLALPCLVYSMDLTVLNLALPAITNELRPTGTQMLWIVDIYGFIVAGSLITMGTIGDRIGRRRLLLIGAAAFGLASVAAAFSRTASELIASRALLGFAGATLAPSTLSLIRNMFQDERERTMAVGIWITSYSLGGAIGPLLGGSVLAHFHWGYVFLMGVPVMVLLLVLGPFLLPEYRDPHPGRPDPLSAALSLGAVLGMIYGMKRAVESGWTVWAPLSFAGGALLAYVFIRRQRRLQHPFIDLTLFRSPGFVSALLVYLVATAVGFSGFVFVAQYLQLVMGMTPFQAGLHMLPSMLAFVVGSLATPLLARRISERRLITGGLAIGAAGFALLAWVDGTRPLLLMTAFALYSVGLVPVFTLAVNVILSAAPPEKAGAASAISETSSELGGAGGIAVFGSLGLWIYRDGMQRMPLDNLPSEALRAAQDTLGGAVGVAGRLADPAGAVLLAGAWDAFTRAFRAVAGLSAIILLAFCVWLHLHSKRMPQTVPDEDRRR